jgi:hypothetical protein
MTGSQGGRPKLGLNAKKAKASLKLTKAAHLAIRKQKRNAVVTRQVAASLAMVHEWPCLSLLKTVKNVFKRMHDGDQNAEKQRKGAGQNRKLNKDNPGLIAAAAALNNGTPTKLAV